MSDVTIQELLAKAGGVGGNMTVFKSIAKTYHILSTHHKIVVSVSGGADSDIILDLIYRVNQILNKDVTYVWFDTGLEYEATKKHLKYLEDKYHITIARERAIKPIPLTCREYGQPFLSKMVSGAIYGLQRNGFKWEDKPYEELILEYPKCKSYISWWCNHRDTKDFGYSIYNINYNKWLKEFIIANPPTFKIANRCCKYAKKDVSKEILKKYDCDLLVVGIRKSEGGIRSVRYKTCYDDNGVDCDTFRPIFWYVAEDKVFYDTVFGVEHSECYTRYGMRRTGCAGCPYNRQLDDNLKVLEDYEPKLYRAVNAIFGESYAYTQKYREFCQAKQKENEPQQIKLFDVSE